MQGERIERANLGVRIAHPTDAERDCAKLGNVDDRMMSEIDLRDLHVPVPNARERGDHLRVRGGASQAGEHGGASEIAGLARRYGQELEYRLETAIPIECAGKI